MRCLLRTAGICVWTSEAHRQRTVSSDSGAAGQPHTHLRDPHGGKSLRHQLRHEHGVHLL